MSLPIKILHQQFMLVYPLVVLLVLVIAFAVYVHYSTDKKFRLKLLLGPIVLTLASVSFVIIGGKLGFGFPLPLPQRFEFIAYNVMLNEERTAKVWIDVMLLTKSQQNPRLHRVPWSQKLEDSLKTAQKMKQGAGGGSVVMESDGKGKQAQNGKPGEGDTIPEDTYVPKRVVPSDIVPKGPMPALPPGIPPITTEPERQEQQRVPNYSV